MNTKIHPTYYPNAVVKCLCGNEFTTGSTKEEIKTETCSVCHPFFTGQQMQVRAGGRVEKFNERAAKAKNAAN